MLICTVTFEENNMNFSLSVFSLLNNVTTCLAPIHPQCDVMMRKNFEGMTAGLEYMCNDNHSEGL